MERGGGLWYQTDAMKIVEGRALDGTHAPEYVLVGVRRMKAWKRAFENRPLPRRPGSKRSWGGATRQGPIHGR